MTDYSSRTLEVDDCHRQLARCQRLAHDLEAQLRHAVAEQVRIRQTLQARLTEVTLVGEQKRQAEAGRQAASQVAAISKLTDELQQSRDAAAQLKLKTDQARLALESRLEAMAASQAAAISKLTDELQQSRDVATQLKLKTDQARLALELRFEAVVAEHTAIEASWQSRHAAALQALAVGEAELHGVYQSLSWRLTAPLRGLKRLLGRRRRT